jgi:heat shock protein HtpX
MLFMLMGVGLVLLGFAVGYYFHPAGKGIDGIIIALLIWIVLSLISYFRGAKILLSASHAKKVTQDVHPQLFNIVEEMTIAAGLPKMPEIYIINEEAPNAFAAGRDPKHAVVAVTAGLLTRLNRDELQGVIAHEMAHIYNRDIRFMTLAGVMLGSIVLISEIFLRGMLFSGGGRSRSSGSKDGQGQAIIMIIALVVAILVPIFAGMLYYAISRKREYLADATGVRFSRYPEGLASALEKISGSKIEMKSANKVTAPMYISLPFQKGKKAAAGLHSTHPPIQERIRILRSMQGAGYLSYQEAYKGVKGEKSGIIPGSGLRDADDPGIRSAFGGSGIADTKTTKRNTGDLMMTVDNYTFINCPCGLKIKVPPDYKKKNISCPRCGIAHTL